MPPAMVDDAVEEIEREPPVMVKPLDELRPVVTKPPDQVEVAVEVFVIDPPVIARPDAERRPPYATSPPEIEEVAVELEVR